jgi:hypothetical protein
MFSGWTESTLKRLGKFVVCIFAAASLSLSALTARPVAAQARYLLFQIFTYSPPSGPTSDSVFPPPGQLSREVEDIVSRIGTTGSLQNKLGFAVGPLTFNHSDDEIRKTIKESFRIAREKNVAVAFHLDTEKFWCRNPGLTSGSCNVEWLDWRGTTSTGRRLDWSEKPAKVDPQMCFNTPAIKAAVSARACLIGTEIAREVVALRAAGKEELFAGVIVGWETAIGRDFATNSNLGYHALANVGFGAKNTQAQCDARLVEIVKEFMVLWANGIAQSGVVKDKIYCHIAFTSQGLDRTTGLTYAQQVGFACPDVAFSKAYLPGFSTYPEEGTIENFQKVVAAHGNPPWISAEGTNVVPNGLPGESGMETYLGKMFNHHAVMVNIFSWGIGGEAEKNNFFRRATENDEALSAYRKFLTGKALIERAPLANAFSVSKFKAKIQAIQVEVPPWIQRARRVDIVQPRMMQLDSLCKQGKIQEADKVADEILRIVGGK